MSVNKACAKLNQNPEIVYRATHLANVAKVGQGCCALHCLFMCSSLFGNSFSLNTGSLYYDVIVYY